MSDGMKDPATTVYASTLVERVVVIFASCAFGGLFVYGFCVFAFHYDRIFSGNRELGLTISLFIFVQVAAWGLMSQLAKMHPLWIRIAPEEIVAKYLFGSVCILWDDIKAYGVRRDADSDQIYSVWLEAKDMDLLICHGTKDDRTLMCSAIEKICKSRCCSFSSNLGPRYLHARYRFVKRALLFALALMGSQLYFYWVQPTPSLRLLIGATGVMIGVGLMQAWFLRRAVRRLDTDGGKM